MDFKLALFVLGIFVSAQGLPRERNANRIDRNSISPATKLTRVDECGIAPLAGNSTPRPQLKLSGGGEVWPPHSFPWMARIKVLQVCQQGVLISEDWVLSTATYFGPRGYHREDEGLWVFLGMQDRSYPEDSELTIVCHDAYSHPKFNSESHGKYDIALVRLPQKVTYTDYIRPICLPAYSDPVLVPDDVITLTGWGATDTYSIDSITLLMVDLRIIEQAECKGEYGDDVFTGTVCTSGEGGKGPCSHDFGGPMNYKKEAGGITYLGGLASHGEKQCQTLRPWIFTRVSYHLQWISNMTGILIDP